MIGAALPIEQMTHC